MHIIPNDTINTLFFTITSIFVYQSRCMEIHKYTWKQTPYQKMTLIIEKFCVSKMSVLKRRVFMMTSSNGIFFQRYWPFVRGIHRSPVNSPHKNQWRGALMFSLICAWIHGWVNDGEAGDLRCHRAHYDVTVMWNTMACRQLNLEVLQRDRHFHKRQ